MKIEYNLEKIESLCSLIKADLIVLPELVTSGYVFNHKSELESVAEPLSSGKSFSFFNQLSAKLDASVVYGFPEKANGKIYNTSVLINPNGRYHIYRKTHLFYKEKLFFSPGDTGINVFAAKNGVKIGMMICFDWQFPETARTLALKGAQIICHPSNLVLPWCQHSMVTRSLENRVFSITANRTGIETNGETSMEFTGQSQILSTRGEVLVRLSSDEENVGIAEINPELALDKTINDFNDAFGDRRQAFYTELLKPR